MKLSSSSPKRGGAGAVQGGEAAAEAPRRGRRAGRPARDPLEREEARRAPVAHGDDRGHAQGAGLGEPGEAGASAGNMPAGAPRRS